MGKKSKAAKSNDSASSSQPNAANVVPNVKRRRTKKQVKKATAVAEDGAELDLSFQFGNSGEEEVDRPAASEQGQSSSTPCVPTPNTDASVLSENEPKEPKKSKSKPKKRKSNQAGSAQDEVVQAAPATGVSEPQVANAPTSNLHHVKDDGAEVETNAAINGLTEGDDFISLNFDDSEDDEEAASDSEHEKPTAFEKVAAKLGKFVQESKDPLKRKRNENGDFKKSRKRKRETCEKDPYPWLQGVSYAQEHEPARILHRELLDFVKFVGPTEEEHRVRTFVISRIQKLVEKKWPSASLHVFGSFETKLYLPTSDIDLVVLSSPEGETYEKPNHLRRLANWLVKARIAENIQVITSARVPIIKFIDSVTKINVDISFNKPSGLVAAGVVKRYTEKMPALRPLVVFIKHFLNMRGLNEVYLGGLGSYSIICMVISFLQRHPKVATGQILQEENLGVLVVEFFELYGKRFNYDNVGINIEGVGRYFNKVEYGWQRSGQTYLLSIEDPTDPDNDIAKSSFGILKVKSTFGGGHDFLVQRLYDVNDRIKDGKRADVGLDSILSAVVSIDEDMKTGRQFIASCFESGIVQEELNRMEESEGEIHEVPSFDYKGLVKEKSKSSSSKHLQFVAEDESEDDDELIDNDGHKFVRPEGYRPPELPGQVDDLYSKLNAAPVHPVVPAIEIPAAGVTRTDGEVYIIESSDDEAHKRHNKNTTSRRRAAGEVINLDSDNDDDDGRDSKVVQVDKSARTRYWEAKGKENNHHAAAASLVDDYDDADAADSVSGGPDH